ncbi:MAG: hypothetical protein GKR91_06775 [Pseudomonadales bacterium]|nr:hypothetical protein [Pseudomonadales bacterium]
MQNPIVKSLLAVILSIAVAVVLFMVVEGIGSILYPFPEDFGGTFEEVARQVETTPAWVMAFLAGVGWGGLMLACTFIATRLGHNRHPGHGYGVGLFLLAMAVYNMAMLPYPIWLWVLNLTVLPAAAYLGTTLAQENQLTPEQ